jgi:hypothetical protein
MTDLAQQIKAWADATAPPSQDRVRAADILAADPRHVGGSGRTMGRRWLVVAAAVVVGGALGASALLPRDDRATDRVRTGESDGTATTSTSTAVPKPESVPFRSLASNRPGSQIGSDEPPGALHAAQTPGEVGRVWLDAGQPPPIPKVDLEREVVVSLTTWGSPCDVLVELVRTGSRLAPRFDERPNGENCDASLWLQTNVIAIEWADIEPSTTLEIPGHESQYPDLPETAYGDRSLKLTQVDQPELSATLELQATEVAAGGTIAGTVTVVNDTGAAVEGSTCGPPFATRLTFANGYRQDALRGDCVSAFSIPEGRSTYPVTVDGSYLSCLGQDQRPGGSPYCQDDGSPPPLEAGTYLLTIDGPSAVSPPDPVEITID